MNHPQVLSQYLGKAALFFHQGHLHFTYIDQVMQDKLCLTDTKGNTFTLSPSRIILLAQSGSISNIQLLQDFKQNALDKSKAFTKLDLAGEAFPELCQRLNLTQDSARFGLFVHLKNNPLWYYQKHDKLFTRSEEETQAYLLAQNQADQRRAFLSTIDSYLKNLNSALPAELKPEDSSLLLTQLQQMQQGLRIDDLEKLASRRNPYPSLSEYVVRIRKSLGDEADDPALMESGLPISFNDLPSKLNLKEAELPLADHTAFCIDDEDTLDYDDAISIQSSPSGFRIGIHVSNLAQCLSADHPLFTQSLQRISSLYLPSLNVPMLPIEYSQGRFSLRSGEQKQVLSLYLDFSTNLELKNTFLKAQVITISQNFSYNDIDKDRTNPELQMLFRIAAALKDQRDPAMDKERFYYSIKASSSRISMRKVDSQSPARMVIEELMIQYNRCIAQYASSLKLPLLYRNINQFLDDFQEVRNSSAYLSTTPGYHPGIGAEAYLHATSPIRRVVDMINQMQVYNSLYDQPIHFSEDNLKRMIPHIEKRILLIRETVIRSERYWFLKYIEQELLNKPLQAQLRGYVNGRLKALILPWGKQVLLDTNAKPDDEYFHLVVYKIDWSKQILLADIIG